MLKQPSNGRDGSIALGRDGQGESVAGHSFEELTRLLDNIGLLGEQLHGSHPSGRAFLEQVVHRLHSRLIGIECEIDTSRPPTPRRGLAYWQVKRVTSYMRDRLEEEIVLNELAALVNLSRFHFCTAFRLATGRTPREWLTHERMARAKRLLADPDLRITDIALAVGYTTPSAFAATFRKVVGRSPSEFRRWL